MALPPLALIARSRRCSGSGSYLRCYGVSGDELASSELLTGRWHPSMARSTRCDPCRKQARGALLPPLSGFESGRCSQLCNIGKSTSNLRSMYTPPSGPPVEAEAPHCRGGHPAPEFEDVVEVIEFNGLPPVFDCGLPVAVEQGGALGVINVRVAIEGFGEVHKRISGLGVFEVQNARKA